VFIQSLSEPVVNEEVFTYRPLACYRWITSYTTGSRAYSNKMLVTFLLLAATALNFTLSKELFGRECK